MTRIGFLVLLLSIAGLNTDGQEIVRSTYTYKAIGDLRIRADVYRKPDDSVRPAILWLHGGALIMGSRRWLNQGQAERYLNAGYTIIAIDYRLAPQTKLSQILVDLEDAYRWVRIEGPKLFRIDPNRIAVIGHSAGGYLALMAGFRLNPRPMAIVSFYGYGDIAAEWYSRPDSFYNRQPPVSKEEAYKAVGTRLISDDLGTHRGPFYLYTRQQGLWPMEVVGHDPHTEPRLFDSFCPLRNVTKDYPPTVLLHGDKDTDVPFEQSVLMAKEFERHGVQHQFFEMVDRGHGFDGAMWDPVIIATFDRLLAFLEKQHRRY
ncbi:MAG TPA: alpha/beta hydrolase [Chitinophagaceae bacterium]|nr:alpha/beta hydrolase [Chitinophagaceae bacterium]